MSNRRRSPLLAGLTLSVLCGACYTYQPLDTPVPRVGAEVRAQLANPIDVQVGDLTLNGVNLVEGRVYQTGGDSVFVWGDWLYTQVGSRYSANGGALLLDRERIGSLQVRRLSPARSGVAGVASVGIVFLLFRLVEAAFGGGGNNSQPPDPN